MYTSLSTSVLVEGCVSSNTELLNFALRGRKIIIRHEEFSSHSLSEKKKRFKRVKDNTRSYSEGNAPNTHSWKALMYC